MSIFIIAELGINHNGDLTIAKKLIDLAKDIGCDAVKFQKRTIEVIYNKEFLDSPRESPWGYTQRSQKMGLEFNEADYIEIDSYCKKKEINWFASAWDIKSQLFLRQFNLKYNKVASAMLIHKKLLHTIAEERKYTFISTGMSSMEDVTDACKIFYKTNCPFELMHCVSTYPTKPEDVNLSFIKTLRDRFHCNIGYSGHENGIAISCAAAAMGITSLERHITLDRAMYGSDQAASLGPEGFRQLVGAVRKIEKAVGDGKERILEAEKENAKKLRAHINKE